MSPVGRQSAFGPDALPSGGAADGAPRRRVRAWDVALSVVFLVLALLTALIGTLSAIVTLAFVDCQPGVCSMEAAISAEFVTCGLALLVFVVGLIATITLLARRRRGWWAALLTLALMVAAWVFGYLLFAVAVGWYVV